jgi:hypothetical protein
MKKRRLASGVESLKWEDQINEMNGIITDVKEVWFAGCHCDIGGGSVKNNTRNSLARIPLRWMIRECFRTNIGIIFDKDMLKSHIGLDADTLYPYVLPRPERLLPSPGATIAEPKTQIMAGVSVMKTLGQLLILPITFVSGLLAAPFHALWLLLKYTGYGKSIRKAYHSVRDKITGKGKGKGKDAEASQPLIEVVPQTPFISEEDEELADALSPEFDQLQLSKGWWLLEFIPFRFREQRSTRDDFFVRANFGRGRKIYGDALKNGLVVHRSVRTRLEVVRKGGKAAYHPRAWFKTKGPTGKKEAGPKTWVVDDPSERNWHWVE